MKKHHQDPSEVINAILAGDLEQVKALYGTGCLLFKKGRTTQLRKNIPKTIGQGSRSCTIYMDAFEFALSHGQTEIARFFIGCGILGPDALFRVTGQPELFSCMVESGIQLEKTESAITSLFLQLADRWNDTWKAIIQRMDLPLAEYGGPALCYAAQDGHRALAEYLLSAGVPVDCRNRSSQDTPILCAVKSGHFDMVKDLIEQGADLSLKNDRGIRPFTAARMNGRKETADYIYAHEPADLHSEEAQEQLFRTYHVPEAMQEYLKKEDLRLEFPEEKDVHWIRLFPWMEVPEISYHDKRGLSLVEDSEDFDFMLLWEPESEKIWFLDREHDIFHAVCTWPKFIQDPGTCVNRAVLWDFD